MELSPAHGDDSEQHEQPHPSIVSREKPDFAFARAATTKTSLAAAFRRSIAIRIYLVVSRKFLRCLLRPPAQRSAVPLAPVGLFFGCLLSRSSFVARSVFMRSTRLIGLRKKSIQTSIRKSIDCCFGSTELTSPVRLLLVFADVRRV